MKAFSTVLSVYVFVLSKDWIDSGTLANKGEEGLRR